MTYAIPPRAPLGLKRPALKSTAVRASAAGQPCTLRLDCCTHDPATTVLAHIRMFGWAGMAQKPADYLAVFACEACHREMDARNSALCGTDDVLRALGETLTHQFATGVFRT